LLKRFAVSSHEDHAVDDDHEGRDVNGAAYALARWSLSVDQPSQSGDGARSQDVPG
jgi:hypothetical protein